MKKSFLLLLAFLLAACSTPTPIPAPTPSAKSIEAEEVAVYAALFAAMYPDQPLVLMAQTATGPGGTGDTASTLEYALGQMTGVAPETAASFQVRNEAAHPLDPEMALGIQFVLLSEDDMRQIFDINQDGWTIFYSRYPNTPGMTTVSRVGFNDTLDQALVYVGTQSHWLAGAGYIVLMKKVDGVWTIDQQVMTWIS
ncbi:MAG: hypothetical protein FD146_1180 [Anaerolineaceae bacterium]|nr:MAG: hypothetical protein FD146_1180 [Anaerolineaceae bacterium]